MERTAFLTKAATFNQEPVDLEGFDGVVVRELSAADAEDLDRRRQAQPAPDELTLSAWVITRMLRDQDGRQILTDDDVDAVKQWPARVLRRIGQIGQELADGAKKNGSST